MIRCLICLQVADTPAGYLAHVCVSARARRERMDAEVREAIADLYRAIADR